MPGGSWQRISLVYYQSSRDSNGDYIFPVDFYLNGTFMDRITIKNQGQRPTFDVTDKSLLHKTVSFKNIRYFGSTYDFSTPYPWTIKYFDLSTNDLSAIGRVYSNTYSDNTAPAKYNLSFGSGSTSIINSGALGSWYFYIYSWGV